jgi:hypothetical protein
MLAGTASLLGEATAAVLGLTFHNSRFERFDIKTRRKAGFDFSAHGFRESSSFRGHRRLCRRRNPESICSSWCSAVARGSRGFFLRGNCCHNPPR